MPVLPVSDFSSLAFLGSALGHAGLALVFLLLHLLCWPLIRPSAPFLWQLAEKAGEEIDRRLNRDSRSPRELFYRGLLVAVLMISFGVVIGKAAGSAAMHPFGWLVTLVLLSLSVSVMGPLKLLRLVAVAKDEKSRKQAATLLQPLLKDDLGGADEYTLARRAIEVGALGVNKFFVAPLFWFILTGPVGLGVYVMIAALYDAYGVNDSRHLMFAGIVRGLEKALDFVPARIAALLIALAAVFVSRAAPLEGLRIAFTQAGKYRSTNRGWLIAAMAGGLGVTLGGPLRHRRGHTIEHGWIGPAKASARIQSPDVQRAALMQIVAFLLGMTLLTAIIYVNSYYT